MAEIWLLLPVFCLIICQLSLDVGFSASITMELQYYFSLSHQSIKVVETFIENSACNARFRTQVFRNLFRPEITHRILKSVCMYDS